MRTFADEEAIANGGPLPAAVIYAATRLAGEAGGGRPG